MNPKTSWRSEISDLYCRDKWVTSATTSAPGLSPVAPHRSKWVSQIALAPCPPGGCSTQKRRLWKMGKEPVPTEGWTRAFALSLIPLGSVGELRRAQHRAHTQPPGVRALYFHIPSSLSRSSLPSGRSEGLLFKGTWTGKCLSQVPGLPTAFVFLMEYRLEAAKPLSTSSETEMKELQGKAKLGCLRARSRGTEGTFAWRRHHKYMTPAAPWHRFNGQLEHPLLPAWK